MAEMTHPTSETEGIAADDLHAGYGSVEVVHGVSLHFSRSESVLLTGHNGAGKSTLVETMVGLLRGRGGSVKVGGITTTGWSPRRLRKAGVVIVPQGGGVLRELTVEENVRFFRTVGRCRTRGMQIAEASDTLIGIFPDLFSRRSQRAGTLSGGEFRLLSIINAVVSEPKYLIIDEPFLGVARGLCDLVKRALLLVREAQTGTLIVEQQIHLIDDLVDRCYVMRQGTMVEELTARELHGLEDVSRIL